MYSTVILSFSDSRMKKYEDEFTDLPEVDKQSRAVDLYFLNIDISSLFLAISGVYEVLIRNAVVEIIEKKYGDRWFTDDTAFVRSIRGIKDKNRFCPKRHLKNVIDKHGGERGQIISDLKFAFWELILKPYQNKRLWSPFLVESFPHYRGESERLRAALEEHIRKVRRIRNRAAHHEPIYHLEELQSVVDEIFDVIGYRSPDLIDRLQPKRLKMQAYLERIRQKRQIA